MGFPSPPARLSSPDYPEAVLDFNLSLSRKDLQILAAQGEDGDAIQALTKDMDVALAQLAAEETTEDERQALVDRAANVTAELETARQAARLQYGETLARAYCAKEYTAYGVTIDFRTAEAALATLDSAELPEAFVTWLQYAPALAVSDAEARILKNFRTSLPKQSTIKK